mmetsp:Transcript_70/g.73  ORF Transcript_70/g.73 Transcript_70/m.73 type:complete len:419 (-) Transcript_70:189-1445(-)
MSAPTRAVSSSSSSLSSTSSSIVELTSPPSTSNNSCVDGGNIADSKYELVLSTEYKHMQEELIYLRRQMKMKPLKKKKEQKQEKMEEEIVHADELSSLISNRCSKGEDEEEEKKEQPPTFNILSDSMMTFRRAFSISKNNDNRQQEYFLTSSIRSVATSILTSKSSSEEDNTDDNADDVEQANHHQSTTSNDSNESDEDNEREVVDNNDDKQQEEKKQQHEHDKQQPHPPAMTFRQSLTDRAGWLIGLLVFQSLSSFILKRNEALLQRHPFIVQFLTMLVGAGGNAGNQASVGIIRGIATGAITTANCLKVLRRESTMGLALAMLLGGAGLIRAKVFFIPWMATIVITVCLFMIVLISVIVGATLPLCMQAVGIDPAHSSTSIQVIMDITGVLITVNVSTLLLDSSFHDWLATIFSLQ